VLAEQQGAAVTLFAELVDEPALEALRIVKLDLAEEIDFQRGQSGGRQHRDSFPPDQNAS
jgi:hypothetical protein